ncbi:MAG TPA: hypothetical protein VK395_20230 [Gemmataceae bacterium]|nr:hypothetical protein [Gemmataceae bacterium]
MKSFPVAWRPVYRPDTNSRTSFNQGHLAMMRLLLGSLFIGAFLVTGCQTVNSENLRAHDQSGSRPDGSPSSPPSARAPCAVGMSDRERAIKTFLEERILGLTPVKAKEFMQAQGYYCVYTPESLTNKVINRFTSKPDSEQLNCTRTRLLGGKFVNENVTILASSGRVVSVAVIEGDNPQPIIPISASFPAPPRP